MKLFVTGIVISALFCSVASAQTSREHEPQRSLTPGMVVTNGTGAKVAIIKQVGRVRDGSVAVLLDVNGSQFMVPAWQLTPSPKGEQAVTSLSDSEIRTLELEAD
jgi:hypothetical protein